MVIYESLTDHGNRTLIALRELGIARVNIEVYEGSEKEIVPMRLLLESQAISPVHPADKSVFLFRLMSKYKYNIDIIAQLFGRKEYVQQLIKIGCNCVKAVLDAWRRRLIKKKHAIILAEHYTKQDTVQQLRILRNTIGHQLTPQQLDKLVQLVLRDPSINITRAIKIVTQ